MFLHPFLLLLGLAAATLPVIVHWLTRPKPVRMSLSTIHLVSDVVDGRRSRDQLRDFLILLLRCLALAMLAMAIARPLMLGDARPNDPQPADRIRVVLVDASGSMGAIEGASTRFDRARAAAAKELKFRSGLQANLLLASHDPGAVFESPSGNLQLLRQRLGDAVVSASALNVSAALDEAGRQLATGSIDATITRELVIISDFQRTNWSRANFASLPDEVEVRMIPLGEPDPGTGGESIAQLGNVAIRDVRLSSTPTLGKPVSLAVEIANYSSDVRQVSCRSEMGTTARTAKATIGANEIATVSLPLDWNQSGWQLGRVRLLDALDARPADDVVPLAIGVRPELRYALVTDTPLTPGTDGDFIAKVLTQSSGSDDETAIDDVAVELESRLAVITPSMLDTPPAQIAATWIIADVESWDEAATGRAAAWLRAGKSILYVAGHPADANHLQQLREALGNDMQPPVELIASLESQSRAGLRIDQTDAEHLPLSVFGSQVNEILSTWRIGGGLPTRTLDASGIDRIAATLSDRSVLLYFADVGAGRLAVLNADLSRSNIGYQAGFVPLILETIHRLTDVQGGNRATFSGQPITREIPVDVGPIESLVIHRQGLLPDDEPEQALLTDQAGKIQERDALTVWNWSAAGQPGVYRIADAGNTTVWAEAVTGDPDEQDLRVLSTDVVRSRLAGGRELRLQSSEIAAGREDTLWVWAVIAMLACVVTEWATLLGFRS